MESKALRNWRSY